MGIALIVEPSTDQLKALVSKVKGEVKPVKLDPRHQPGDPRAMRGIPLVGAVGGCIQGTRPGDDLGRLLRDEKFLSRRRKVKRVEPT